jgi:hypothetical protein
MIWLVRRTTRAGAEVPVACVVRADTEEQAVRLATLAAGARGERPEVTCRAIEPDGPAGIILAAYTTPPTVLAARHRPSGITGRLDQRLDPGR